MSQQAGGSPIFVKTHDFVRWLVPKTLNFPKSQRGVLARRLQHLCFDLYECLIDATMVDRPLAYLQEADRILTKLRSYIRMSHELTLLNSNSYRFASEQTAEIGRLLGGWQRSLRKHRSSPTG
ncbi:MAG: diversity-generating retroelement protein Avd [Candidatus Promineifilaceae bacterium]